MLEDALMESGGRIKTQSKYWSIASFILYCQILATLVIWPLFHPETLPKQMMAMLLVAPPPPAPPSPVQKNVPMKSEMLSELQAPSKIPKKIEMMKDQAALPQMSRVSIQGATGSGNETGVISSLFGTGSVPIVEAAPPKKLSVFSGVMAGNLISKTMPIYPAIAKATRIQGTVVLHALISKEGTIQNLQVINGPPMLQQAAVEAVRTWRYRPYLLNNEPVEVETTINVVFNLE